MRVVTIARKPCVGSMTGNVLKWDCGAINIDGTRISTTDKMSFGEDAETTRDGRWPANLMLQHKPGCERVGKRVLPGYVINTWVDGAKPFGGGAGHEYESRVTSDEEEDVWQCVDECVVAALDAQSGYLRTGRVASHSDAGIHGWKSGKDVDYADQEKGGGASKFFCQIQHEGDLWDYLCQLITPPDECDPFILAEPDLAEESKSWEWGHLPDDSVHGIILEGEISEHVEEILRILRPGAHCLVISTSKEPTGWRSACHLEEGGFEIRDSICLLDDDSDQFHFVTKAGTKERNEGLPGHLENKHETVKPWRVMAAVLGDVPEGSRVVDPFMGTGTTGMGCIVKRHDFLGIERNENSFEIAYHRILHWNSAHASWLGAEIESDLEPEEENGPMSIEDLFS